MNGYLPKAILAALVAGALSLPGLSMASSDAMVMHEGPASSEARMRSGAVSGAPGDRLIVALYEQTGQRATDAQFSRIVREAGLSPSNEELNDDDLGLTWGNYFEYVRAARSWLTVDYPLPGGRYVVLWLEDDYDRAHYQLYTAARVPLGVERVVDITGSWGALPVVLAQPDGGFDLIWNRQQGERLRVYEQRHSAGGMPVGKVVMCAPR